MRKLEREERSEAGKGGFRSNGQRGVCSLEEKGNEGKAAECCAARAEKQPSLSCNISLIFAPFKRFSSSAPTRK